VAELTELIGFRAIEPLDAERWLDDDNGVAVAVALPQPQTYL
jgi:hypothetical protein